MRVLALRFVVAIAAIFTMSIFFGCDKFAADKEEIRDVYERFSAAVAARDGAAATALVSAESVSDNDRVTRLAMTAAPAAVRKLPIADRYEIFLTRHLAAGEKSVIKKLGELKGAELFAYQIKMGWAMYDPAEKIRLGKIRITGTGAEADVIVDGEKDSVPVYFVRENGRWLRDLTQHHRLDREVAGLARQHKMTEDDLILLVIEEWTHRPPDSEEIWKPLAPGGGGGGGGGLFDP